jgi:hypothetical protein
MCQTDLGLATRGPHYLACSHCGFVGDAIHYFAGVRKMSIADAISSLEIVEAVTPDTRQEVSDYLFVAEEQARLRRLLKAGRSYYSDFPGNIRQICEDYGCWFSEPAGQAGSNYHVAMIAQMLEDHDIEIPKSAKSAMQTWGKYAAIAIPAYSEWRIVGFWLVLPKRANLADKTLATWTYLSLYPGKAMGYANLVGDDHDTSFVVRDPSVAFRFNMRQWADGGIKAPFVVATETPSLFHLTGTQPVFVPSLLAERAEVFHGALGVLGAGCLWYSPDARDAHILFDFYEGFGRPGLTSSGIVNSMIRASLPPHEAMGRLLLAQDIKMAQKMVAAYSIPLAHRNQILTYFEGADLRDLKALFVTDDAPRSVDIDGKIITERSDGWYHGNSLISSVILVIKEITTDPVKKTHVASGTLTFKGKTWNLDADYDALRKNPAKWIEDFILLRSGNDIPFMKPAWARELLRIAAAFNAPTRSTLAATYGWQRDSGVLCMPHFSVLPSGVVMTESRLSGPQIQAPVNLGSRQWAAWDYVEFATMAVVLTGNLMRTREGLGGTGIVVHSAQHVVEKVAGVLGIHVVTDPDAGALARHAENPLVMPVTWSSQEVMEAALKPHGPKNILVSADRLQHKLLRLHPGWACLDIYDVPCVENLNTIFLLLPDLLTKSKSGFDTNPVGFYSRVAGDLANALRARKVDPAAVLQAGSDLGRVFATPDNSGGLVLAHLWSGVDAGGLHVETKEGVVVFNRTEVSRLFMTPGLPRLEMAFIERLLIRANLLVKNTPTEWGIEERTLNIYSSIFIETT